MDIPIDPALQPSTKPLCRRYVEATESERFRLFHMYKQQDLQNLERRLATLQLRDHNGKHQSPLIFNFQVLRVQPRERDSKVAG